MKYPTNPARGRAAVTTKRAALTLVPVTVIALAVAAFAAPASAAPGNAFDYANYPNSATVSRSCSGADLVTNKITVGGWTGTDLESAPALAAGQTVSWTFHNTNAACTHDVASLALYAAENPSLDGTDQTSARSSSVAVPGVGWTSTVSLTLQPTFTGPYQLDAIFGQPLPVVGTHGSYYGGYLRSQGSDSRDMLVTAKNGAIGAPGPFADVVTERTPFDYSAYSAESAHGACDIASGIQDGGDGEGFTVNGTHYGSTKFALAVGDTVSYTYKTTRAACDGKPFTLAFYRNPDGGNGLIDMQANQRLVVSDSKTSTFGDSTTLELTVPSDFTGGYQLDAVAGPALPVVGDVGRTYGSVDALKMTNYNLVKPAA